MALQDTESNQGVRSIEGDIVALLASMGYGVYTTAIRLLIPDDEGISMQLLLGYIGAINAVMAFPVLLAMVNSTPNMTNFTNYYLLLRFIFPVTCCEIVTILL